MFAGFYMATALAVLAIVGGLVLIIFCLFMYVTGKYTHDNNKERIVIPGYIEMEGSIPMFHFVGGIVLIILGFTILSNEDKTQNNRTEKDDISSIEINKSINQSDDLLRLSKENEDLKRKLEKLESPVRDIAKDTCDSLARTGYYGFHKSARYIFTSDEFTKSSGIRATAVSGSWEDVYCEADNMLDGAYLLKGTDTTTHEIEIKDEKSGQFFRIGTAKAKYESEVQIKSDGTLGLRRMLGEVGKMIPKYDCPEYEKMYSNKMIEYDNERKKRHTEDDSKQAQRTTIRNPCITLRGQDNSEIVLAFACNDYTRTLIQQKRNTRISLPQQNKQCISAEGSK